MLDIQKFRNEPDAVRKGLEAKAADPALVDSVLELDERRRELTYKSEQLKKERNDTSKQIGKIIKEGGDAEEIKARVREIGEEIKRLDDELSKIDADLKMLLLSIPNLPHESAPVGMSEEDNVEKRVEG
ncbi:MAG: serine--tRNA ligase, partial [Candidatus Sumerlaeota bacterium]